MQQLSETYASPALRLGLLQEDYPGAKISYSLQKGVDVGIPAEFGGNANVCVARIEFPPSSGRPDVVAYKSAPNNGKVDDWNTLCSKTLGRALKRAGYPDDLVDLKALVHWRQRGAEIQAISSGVALNTPLALPSGLDEAIEAASSPRDVHDENDDDVVIADGDDAHDGVIDAVIVAEVASEPEPEPEPQQRTFDQDAFESLLIDVEGLEGQDAEDFAQFLQDSNISEDPNLWSDDDIAAVDGWFG